MKWFVVFLMVVLLCGVPVAAAEVSAELPAEMTVAEAEEIASGWTTGLSDPAAEMSWILSGKHKKKKVVGGSARFAQYHGEVVGIGVDPSLDVGLLYVDDVAADDELEKVYATLGVSLDLSAPAKKVAGVILGKVPVLGTVLNYLSARVGAKGGINVEGDTLAAVSASVGVEIPL